MPSVFLTAFLGTKVSISNYTSQDAEPTQDEEMWSWRLLDIAGTCVILAIIRYGISKLTVF